GGRSDVPVGSLVVNRSDSDPGHLPAADRTGPRAWPGHCCPGYDPLCQPHHFPVHGRLCSGTGHAALESAQAHRTERIAGGGQQASHQIGGFMIATAFLSMWVSNTATAIMMLPIGLSVVSMYDGDQPEAVRKYAVALLLGIAYAASIGGIGTLIGTPPNALLAGFLSSEYDIQIGFAQWMLIGVPIALTMLVVVWFMLSRKDFGL